MSRPLVLIVDDEPDIRELLEITLGRMQLDTRAASNLAEAHLLLEQEPVNLCLVDMRLPDGDGIDFVRHIVAQQPELPVAMITAHGNMETAIEALKAGAFDFVSKPVDLPVLRRLVETALKLSKTASGGKTRRQVKNGEQQLQGKSQPMQAIRAMIEKLARSQAPVYISGESGTGKELAATLIHKHSPRSEEPFIAVNCGAIPQELMESELFGHTKGSFTGAVEDKKGLFRSAQGGTLFLDEVADLPFSMQVKLLRAIQEKAIRPVGGTKEESVDVRIISATHKNLGELVQSGDFRQDLYYRINVIELHMPPLRDRPEDLPLMIDLMLDRASKISGQAKPRLGKKALETLLKHPFPGNVRELENILERATTLCEDGLIKPDDFGLRLHALPTTSSMQSQDEPLEEYLARVEKEAIVRALESCRWNKTAAAKKLGISFRALRYQLSKLGLEQDQEEEEEQ